MHIYQLLIELNNLEWYARVPRVKLSVQRGEWQWYEHQGREEESQVYSRRGGGYLWEWGGRASLLPIKIIHRAVDGDNIDMFMYFVSINMQNW